jgi:uncharacterized protein
MRYLSELKVILANDELFMDALVTVKKLALEEWCVGAGVIRNIVWSKLHGIDSVSHRDLDVVFFDESGGIDDEHVLQENLRGMRPELPWEIKNQALVHLWYKEKFGFSVEPLTSLEDAISTWPETAICIGAYLDSNDEIQVIAPYGLNDLFTIVLRRNPKRVTKEIFEKRIIEKNMNEKWPKMSIVRI